MQTLKRRQDFVAAAKAFSWSTSSFVLQMRVRADDAPARVGFTCTKKLGNAVVRNRIKRRLREAARLGLSGVARPSFDYVLVGRAAAMSQDFDILKSDLISAANRLHGKAASTTEKP